MPEIMMATAMTDDVPRYARAAIESLGPDDFDTASIRSAAPSYSKSPFPTSLPKQKPPH